METKTIIIADDHPLFRAGVRAEITNNGMFKVVFETGNGTEALKSIIELKPDVAILDIQMPGLTGIEIAEKLKELKLNIKIIFLTMFNDKLMFFKAVNLGVNGYVLKDDAVFDIVNALKYVLEGNEFFSASLHKHIVEKVKTNTDVDKIIHLINSLSQSEKKILILISELNTNEEIAEKLFISKRTVENHKVNMANKLNLENSRALLKFAVKYHEYLK